MTIELTRRAAEGFILALMVMPLVTMIVAGLAWIAAARAREAVTGIVKAMMVRVPPPISDVRCRLNDLPAAVLGAPPQPKRPASENPANVWEANGGGGGGRADHSGVAIKGGGGPPLGGLGAGGDGPKGLRRLF